MGWAFVKRRMQAELGADWQNKFASFEHQPAAAASLGQVHRATSHRRRASSPASCNTPTCSRRSKPTCSQLGLLFAIRRRFDPAIDTTEIIKEIGARMREELDYRREAKHAALYRDMLADDDAVRVPQVWPELSTGRLLTLDWLEGTPLLEHKDDTLAVRNRLATAMFTAWWLPFSRFGVIHGDPHLGNYTVFAEKGKPAGINLLDYGCIRIFPPSFVGGVVDLYNGLRNGDDARVVHAYETWGFRKLSRELIDILNIWARFIYGPLMDDRVRSIADGVKPGEYGRRQAFEVHKALREKGPGDGAARIRADGPRRDRARRRVPASARRAQFPPAVRGGDGGFLGQGRGRPAGGGAQARRPALRRLGRQCGCGTAFPPRRGCDIRHVGLPGRYPVNGQGSAYALRVPAAAIPLGLPLR